jgi:hypothetical protein
MPRTAAQIREHTQAVAEVREYMRRSRLTLEDLVEIGGEDLRARDPKRRRKALHVEKCWALMARLHIKHIDLELPREFAGLAVPEPDFRPRRRRHRTASAQTIENTDNSPSESRVTEPNEINGLAVSSPVEAPATNSAEIPGAIPTRPSEEVAAMPGDDLNHWSEKRKVGHA